MLAAALSYDCRKLEKDPTPAVGILVDCPRCDEDNPLAIERSRCPDCKGTGRSPVSLHAIVSELHRESPELLEGGGQPTTRKRYAPRPVTVESPDTEWCDPHDLATRPQLTERFVWGMRRGDRAAAFDPRWRSSGERATVAPSGASRRDGKSSSGS